MSPTDERKMDRLAMIAADGHAETPEAAAYALRTTVPEARRLWAAIRRRLGWQAV